MIVETPTPGGAVAGGISPSGFVDGHPVFPEPPEFHPEPLRDEEALGRGDKATTSTDLGLTHNEPYVTVATSSAPPALDYSNFVFDPAPGLVIVAALVALMWLIQSWSRAARQ